MLGWGPCPQGLAESSRRRHWAQRSRAGRLSAQPSPEAAEKVRVGVSRPREEEGKEVGEVRQIIRLLPAPWLTAGRKSKRANWFAAQNSQWGMDEVREDASCHFSSRFHNSRNRVRGQVVVPKVTPRLLGWKRWHG